MCTYDANDNLLTEEKDLDADSIVDRRSTYTYDASSNLLTAEREGSISTALGQVKFHTLFTFTYDANGNRLTEESDTGGDGTVDRRWLYTYDADGNRLTEEHDLWADGTVDRRCTHDPPCPPEVHRDLDQSCPDPTCIDL